MSGTFERGTCILVQLVKEVEAQFCREVAGVVCETSVWLL